MHQEKSLTLLRVGPQLAHHNSNDQRHQGYQDKSQPMHWNTNSTTGYFTTCHLHTKPHQICHAHQQTTHQHDHGSSWEDTQWCHYTLPHHQLDIYLDKLSADTPSYLLHSGKSQGFLYYMRQIAMHTMDYIDTATTGYIVTTHIPVEDFRGMLMHIEVELPSTMHLPVSSNDSLHFYWYLYTHVLVVEEQFLLLIDVPIQDQAQQLKIYQVFNLFIPRGNLSAWYDMDTRYLGISDDEMKAIEICNATSHHFHLPPHYENHQMMINISLNTANQNTMNIS